MKKRLLSLIVILSGLLMAQDAFSKASSLPLFLRGKPKTTKTYGTLPLSFEMNQGQVNEKVRFLSRSGGRTLFLTPTESALVSPQVLRMKFEGANPQPEISGLEMRPGKVNHFIGNDPTKWRTHVPLYAKVQYKNLYPQIDLVFYGKERELEYDFIVAPGADPKKIALGFASHLPLNTDPEGNLAIGTGKEQVLMKKPILYQELAGSRKEIRGGYLIRGHQVVFEVGSYDRSLPLVIDPVIVYTTLVGGSHFEMGTAITVDSSENIYMAGFTQSVDFPLENAVDDQNADAPSNSDAFITKLSPDGSTLIYSTYLGGSQATDHYKFTSDSIHQIAVDASGSVSVAGHTFSKDFPLSHPLQAANRGNGDAFVSKLSPDGSHLVFSTYLGGSDGNDIGYGIAVDPFDNVYVTGMTESSNFLTANPLQDHNAGGRDAFLVKLSPDGTTLNYATHLGGSGKDEGIGVNVDATGDMYVAGYTESTDFPTVNPAQPHNGGGRDAFISKLKSDGSSLIYSTYLGGSDMDSSQSRVALDLAGHAYIAGYTQSTDFPTANPVQEGNGGSDDAFIAKLSPDGSNLIFSTYLGGSSSDWGKDIAVHPLSQKIYVTGHTHSANFPAVNPLESFGGFVDTFVAKLADEDVVFSTCLGMYASRGLGIDLAPSGSIYVTGDIQPSIQEKHEAFVTRIKD